MGTGAPTTTVDWDVAAATAARTVKPGPDVPLAEARAAVAELRELAVEAREHVANVTGLHASAEVAPVAVVDRMGWVRANTVGLRAVVDPLVERVRERREAQGSPGAPPRSSAVDAVGARVTGAQVGGMLGFLSARVLGQYELFTEPGAAPRLLLVAPNLVAAERVMGVDPHDFRLWVCLHEETHRVQLSGVPWLAPHLRGEVANLLDATDLDPGSVSRRLGPLADAIRAAVTGGEGPAVIEAVTTAEQRVVLDRVTAVMSLLEGHADYVMDAVGPEVVPTVGAIRRAFEQRRRSAGRTETILRRLMGLDVKLAQYRDGEAFVRGVVDRVGMAGFNVVWSGPETLPLPDEIADPAAWVARVHG